MNLKLRLQNIVSRFFELGKFRIFQIAVIIHVFYFIGSIILFALKFEVDFEVYYKVGEIFITNPSDLYNQANYNFPFRYFPLCAVFFIPFSLLNYEFAFVLFNLFNLFLNIITCVILYKIIIIVRSKDDEINDAKIITYISLFLIGLPQGSNYVLGQINIYVVILVLISLYIFLRYEDLKWQLIGSVL
ncbi:MAG: glycosyltransferase 87 family protein, partial [Promethearchaeota archaeon]